MSKSHDDKLLGSTLPGAQNKVQANLIDGQFVACQPPGPLRIPAFPAPPLDPKKIAEFRNEPGPPSIVDTLVEQCWKAYELECTRRRLAIESSRAIVELSGLHVSEAAIELQERYVRGEITMEECTDDIKRRYKL